MPQSGFESLLAGHRLAGRYHVEEVIGRGGFAAVYRATDERLGRTVAVKVITHSAGAADLRDEIQKRFQREARAIASLQHPNVVTVYDFGADETLGLDFLVMELLEGEVLSERLRRAEPLAVDEALRILIDAAAGVEAGHRAGLVHRDLKPGNVFLARNDHGGPPRVYVLDFGIARFTEAETTQLTRSGRSFLSPAYASPEQLRGEHEVTAAADVFSLGVIGYQMLAREKPFRRDRQHLAAGEGAHPLPLRERNPAVPEAVAAAIHRAMSEDPAERFADAGELARALREAAAQVEALAPVPVAVPVPESMVPAAAPPAPPPFTAVPAPATPAREAAPARLQPPSGGVPVRSPSAPGRGVKPALLAVPLLVVLAIAAWLLAGRRESPRVAERPAAETQTAPAASPPSSAPAAPPAAAPGTAGPGAVRPGAASTGAGTATVPPPAPVSPGAAPQPARGAPVAARPRPATVPPAAPAPPVAARPAPSPSAAAVSRGNEGAEFRENLSHPCQDSGSQGEMFACLQRDYTAADAELNRAYQQKMRELDADGRRRLVQSQRAWLERYDRVLTSYYSRPWANHSRVKVLPSQIRAVRDRTAWVRRFRG
ncbi:MAG: protein kinase domain-containing protein [Longimicrobiaceae bacterium]